MVLKEFHPDVVHIHTIGHASPSILFALNNYPTVLTIHGPEGYTKSLIMYCLPVTDFKDGEYDINNLRLVGKLRYFYYRYINYYIYRLGLRNVDAFITLSNYMKSLMDQEGLESKYIPNGITLFDYKPLEEGFIPNILMYAGRIEKYKGLDYLIRAMPLIIARFPGMKLYIAGEGSCKKELEELCEKLQLQGSVTFFGHVDRNGIQKLYESSSVVVVPSTWPEAFGLIGVEAMSVGRPVVAADVGGISDWLIDGQNGFLVPPKDSRALAYAIIKIFSDQDLYLEMMKNGRKKAEEFDLKKHADNLEKIYLDLISSRK
jgi:glycosyltransferase involved in cell wall biosynthesis